MKHIISLTLVLLCSNAATACDVCGTSSGSQGLGLLPQMYRHFAGLQYQYKTYNSVHPALSDTRPDTHSDEYYQTVQAWGRVCIGKKWQLFAFVPYRYNTYVSENIQTNNGGLGDISLLASYALIQTLDRSTSALQHRLQAGVGIKAPTGKYTGITERELASLPNIQPGTGAWDIPMNINYTLRYKKAGFNTDVMYTLTTPNTDRYKYGNRLNTQLTGFYWLQAGEISILPQILIRNEYALHDYDNYDKNWLNEQTGGNIFSTGCGVQVYYRSWGLQLTYTKAVWQEYAGGYVNYKQGLDAGLMFLF